jgi:hypothetical protein
VEGWGRGLFDTVPEFAWRGLGKLRKASVKIVSVPAENRTRSVPNISMRQLVRCNVLIFQ